MPPLRGSVSGDLEGFTAGRTTGFRPDGRQLSRLCREADTSIRSLAIAVGGGTHLVRDEDPLCGGLVCLCRAPDNSFRRPERPCGRAASVVLHQNILLRSPETLAPQPDTLDLQQNNSSQELVNVDGQPASPFRTPANSSRFPKKGFSAAQQTCSVPGKSCSDADYS